MKIQRFNEIYSHVHTSEVSDNKYPIKCKFKNRIPDPGICYVTQIDFEVEKVHWSNGRISSVTDFNQIEFIPNIFDLFMSKKYNL